MELALAEIAAGLPLAASFAVVGGITTLREGRRRAALNEAMHELRRPLQVLSLSLSADPARAGALDSSLEMAAAALERLDREINGGLPPSRRQEVELGSLLTAAVERWRPSAFIEGRRLRLDWDGSGKPFEGDEVQLAQAVDNMISNAIEHGVGEVRIEARVIEGRARIVVRNRRRPLEKAASPALRKRVGGRHRHGHGLRVVSRVARAHGGTFRLRASATAAEARLELPIREAEVLHE